MVSQSLADDCLENKASIKLSFLPKTVVLVGDNGDLRGHGVLFLVELGLLFQICSGLPASF